MALTWEGVIQNTQTAGTTAWGKTTKTLPEYIGLMIGAALGLLGVIFLILMVYGGYLWMTSRGDDKQVEKAKDTIKNAIIGLVLVIMAYAISSYLFEQLISTAGGAAAT